MILNHEICHGLQNKSHRRIVALSCWMTLWCVWLVVVSRKHISFWECEYIRIHLNSLNLFIKQAGSMALSCVAGWDFLLSIEIIFVICIFFAEWHFILCPKNIDFGLASSTSYVLYRLTKIRFLRFRHSLIFVWFVIRYISL